MRSAVALAALVRAGEVSPRELTEAALRRADARGDLGAFTHLDPERALADADAIAGDDGRPFAGVPTAIKDNRPVAGWPLTMGAAITGDYVAPMDAFLVRRLRDAGFVLVGKTNLPEFGILPTSEPERFGPARNPWNPDHTPGGSSGGAAAAVAGGILPAAHGNDGGGSLRIPAACCGLVGLKVARGRISQGPFLGDSFLVEDGMLTRTVEDTAALLDVLEGYEPGDATWAPPPAEPFAAAAAREPGHLRIGMASADRDALGPAARRRRAPPDLRAGVPRGRRAARVARPHRRALRPAVAPGWAARALHRLLRHRHRHLHPPRAAARRPRRAPRGRHGAVVLAHVGPDAVAARRAVLGARD